MNKKISKNERLVKNRWVLLTGASGGIGEAIAVRLYKAGAKLLLVGRDQNKLVALRSRNEFSAARAAIIVADLNDEIGREKINAACAKLPEPVSILINNAGLSEFGFLDKHETSSISDILTTNLLSPILLTKILLPTLLKAKNPLIVNIGSTFGSIGYPGFAVYSASKFGMRGFTEALRRELANTSIDVCYVAPRATRTTINTDTVNEMNAALGTAMDDPALVAEQILIAIETRKPETYIGWPEKLFVKINQLIPKIVDGALLKQLPIITPIRTTEEKSMKTFYRLFFTTLFLALFSITAMSEEMPIAQSLQMEWDHANFEIADKKQKAKALEALSAKARQAAAANPADAAVQIWTGIILSTYAGEAGMSALGLVKEAKKYFETSLTLDSEALQGSAYTSLGSLYYQVPGWPVGFGDDDKARELLQKGLAIDPNGIDANYFYADFLVSQKDFKAAVHYEKMLAAPAREGRQSADKARRAQAQEALEMVNRKIK